MKRIIASILTCIFLLPALAFAGIPELTGLSDEELIKTINAAYLVLAQHATADEAVIMQIGGLTIIRDGESHADGGYLRIPVIIQNETDTATTIVPDGCIINGWTVTALAPEFAEPQSQVKTELVFKIDEADCKAIEDVKSIQVKYYLEMKADGKFTYDKDAITEISLIP